MDEQMTVTTLQKPQEDSPSVEVAETTQFTPLTCTSCGTAIPTGMKFCPNCGKSADVLTKESKFKRKKTLLISTAVAVATVAIVAVVVSLFFVQKPEKEILAADLVVSTSEIELTEDELTTISCTVYPQDATDKTVVWTSSNPAVATVNELGTITAVKKGECVITAKCGTATKDIAVIVKTKVDFKALYEGIDADVKYAWSVGSDGSYLSADTNVYNTEEYFNASTWASIKEMNKSLGLPASLTEDMLSTTWSMGRQTQKFSEIGIEVTWTYHPDKGMEVTYKLLVE